MQEIRQHLKAQRPAVGYEDNNRERGKKTENIDSSQQSERRRKTYGQNIDNTDTDKQSTVNEEGQAKTSKNAIKQSTEIPAVKPATAQDASKITSTSTSTSTVATTTFHSMTVGYKQSTPAITMDTPPVQSMAAVARQPVPDKTTVPQFVVDMEPVQTVTMPTNSFTEITNGAVKDEMVSAFESEVGVGAYEEECECDMDEYDEEEKDQVDTYRR